MILSRHDSVASSFPSFPSVPSPFGGGIPRWKIRGAIPFFCAFCAFSPVVIGRLCAWTIFQRETPVRGLPGTGK
jgi:hypothetical protein